MPLMTYLEIVQDILNDMDSDPVTTILETEESRQVTQIVETTFFSIIDGKEWSHLQKTFQLTETSAASPTHMTIPINVMDFAYVKYNVRTVTDTKDKYVKIRYVKPEDFMAQLDARDSSATEITQITDATGIFLNIYNERAPMMWTSFDDALIVFDAYDAAIDTNFLATIKTQCRGQIYPTITVDNAFVMPLPIDAFSYLLAEAKSVSFVAIKQAANQKAEQQSTTQRRRMSSKQSKVPFPDQFPNYGRGRRR